MLTASRVHNHHQNITELASISLDFLVLLLLNFQSNLLVKRPEENTRQNNRTITQQGDLVFELTTEKCFGGKIREDEMVETYGQKNKYTFFRKSGGI